MYIIVVFNVFLVMVKRSLSIYVLIISELVKIANCFPVESLKKTNNVLQIQ